MWDPKAYEGREGEADPASTEGEDSLRVVRGGSWNDPARDLAAAVRLRDESSDRDQVLGFRCVVSVPAES